MNESPLFRAVLPQAVQHTLSTNLPADVLGIIADYMHELTLTISLQRDIVDQGNRSRAWHLAYAAAASSYLAS